ncbi:hypothetical protein MRX96_025768 [Rhipicephalus microplus]
MENITRFPVVTDVMPRYRFEKLMRFIHFEDNITVSEEAKEDKIWNIRKWLTSLQENLRSSSSRLRCKSCPWQKPSFSFVYCVKCKVHLCSYKDRNCFATYHQ